MLRKKLPIGIQTLREIREEGYYYVDKSQLAYRLVDEGKYYFLSRPRRFGKSLFLDTLAELFAGNEPLFRGLWCHDRWDWSRRYPVVRMSFAGGRFGSRDELDTHIHELLIDNQQRLGVSCSHQTIAGIFSQLVSLSAGKYGERVVVLVDEYDKPILDNLTDRAVAQEMRDGLRNLYSVIKHCDAEIRFAFLTGVSKFSKVSIFSGLNNLRDITISTSYSAICGYTDRDVDTIFAPELAGLDRQMIRDWYNGYNWSGEAVYNPFDLLLCFQERRFYPYWFESGTPTFLMDWLIAKGEYFTPRLESWMTDLAILSAFDVDNIEAEAMLFQTGYLTLGELHELPGLTMARLVLPNREVRASLNGALLHRLQDKVERANTHLPRLYHLLLANDFSGLKQLFNSFFASIPYNWYSNNPIVDYEGYWASVFYSHFAALGLDIIAEDVTNHGRIDMTVRFNQQIYLFEFKVVEMEPDGKAMAQLKQRDYAAKYRALNQPIHLIGVEFSSKSRSVVGFEVE
jgi:hypothetical protein